MRGKTPGDQQRTSFLGLRVPGASPRLSRNLNLLILSFSVRPQLCVIAQERRYSYSVVQWLLISMLPWQRCMPFSKEACVVGRRQQLFCIAATLAVIVIEAQPDDSSPQIYILFRTLTMILAPCDTGVRMSSAVAAPFFPPNFAWELRTARWAVSFICRLNDSPAAAQCASWPLK